MIISGAPISGVPISGELASASSGPVGPVPFANDFIDYIFEFPDQGTALRDPILNSLRALGAFTATVALLVYNPVETLQKPIPAVGNALVLLPQLAQSSVALPGFWCMVTTKGLVTQLQTHPNIQIVNDRTLMFGQQPSVIFSAIDVTHINIIINNFGVYIRDGLQFADALLLEDAGSGLLLEDKSGTLNLEN